VEFLRTQNPNLIVREDGGEPEEIEFRKPTRVFASLEGSFHQLH
jgi:hypothetical protein